MSSLKAEDGGTAVVSGIFACEDIEKGTRELLEKVESII